MAGKVHPHPIPASLHCLPLPHPAPTLTPPAHWDWGLPSAAAAGKRSCPSPGARTPARPGPGSAPPDCPGLPGAPGGEGDGPSGLGDHRAEPAVRPLAWVKGINQLFCLASTHSRKTGNYGQLLPLALPIPVTPKPTGTPARTQGPRCPLPTVNKSRTWDTLMSSPPAPPPLPPPSPGGAFPLPSSLYLSSASCCQLLTF